MTVPLHQVDRRADGPAAPPTLKVSTSAADCPSPHGVRNKLARAAWGLAYWTLFRPSPRPLWGWRRLLLRAFGATVGAGAKVVPSATVWLPANLELGAHACLGARVDCYNLARVTVGPHATVSQYAHLCAGTHDHADPHLPLLARPVTVGAGAWVCAGAFVGPGVGVGDGAVLGARAVACKNIPAWQVWAGNPARFLKPRALRAPARRAAA